MNKREDMNSCFDCHFCKRISNHTRSSDSGYDCSYANKRIIDDYEYNEPNNPDAQYKYSERTKKYEGNMDIEIPSWCPL
jgi:hypothetical protein